MRNTTTNHLDAALPSVVLLLTAVALLGGCQYTTWLEAAGEGTLYVWIERANVRMPATDTLTPSQTRRLPAAMIAELLSRPHSPNRADTTARNVGLQPGPVDAPGPRSLSPVERHMLTAILYNASKTLTKPKNDPETHANMRN